ncbi:uncharacterized protein LOC141592729 isoform X2 [Silene latifolia]|uniref:uncharacterized protein LOC141592729 isoform X2 n=1 Tax=Silene latifolia TaxID=37657 RepID=UPI003D776470
MDHSLFSSTQATSGISDVPSLAFPSNHPSKPSSIRLDGDWEAHVADSELLVSLAYTSTKMAIHPHLKALLATWHQVCSSGHMIYKQLPVLGTNSNGMHQNKTKTETETVPQLLMLLYRQNGRNDGLSSISQVQEQNSPRDPNGSMRVSQWIEGEDMNRGLLLDQHLSYYFR